MKGSVKHDVIHTGGNIYNDYVSDFDESGRVIVVAESGIYLYASDRDYQMQLNPIAFASGREFGYDASCHDCGIGASYDDIGTTCCDCGRGVIEAGAPGYAPMEDNSQIAGLESSTEYVRVQDTNGAELLVYRSTE